MDVTEELTWDHLLSEYFFAKSLREQSEWSYRKVVSVFRKDVGQGVMPFEVTQRQILQLRRNTLNIKGLSRHTWNNKVRHMSALFNFALHKKWLPQEENPFSQVSVRPEGRQKKTLSKRQLTRIYLVMDRYAEDERNGKARPRSECALFPTDYWLTVLDTFRFTGMRHNQLRRLRLRDINVEEAYINLTVEGSKNYREWRVPMVIFLRRRLEKLKKKAITMGAKPGDYLFDVRRFTGKRVISGAPGIQSVRSFCRRLSRECEFEVSPHRFRHTFATEMMKSPERNLQLTQGMLGHRSISTTMEYVELDLEVASRTLEQELRLYTDICLERDFEDESDTP